MAENDLNALKESDFGQIPIEWEVTSLGQLGKVVTGRTPSTTESQFYGGPFKLISPANLDDSKYVLTAHRWLTESGLSEAKELPRDTVLVGCIGNIGKIGLTSDDRSATNQQINAIICGPRSDPHFVYYLLTYHQRLLETHARRTVVPILSKSNFEQITIPLPPLPEQRRIAHVLSTIQRAIQAQNAVIAAARELKRSMMHRLFTYGPYAEPLPTKETEIGEIPEKWGVSELGQLMTEQVKNGAFVRPHQFGSGIPFLNVADTYKSTAANLRMVERVAIRPDEIEKYELHPGDLVFVRSSLKEEGIGQVCVVREVEERTIYDCHLIRVRVDRARILPDFLAYYFLTPSGRKALIARSNKTTMTTINQQGLVKTLAPIAGLEDQSNVVETLITVERKIVAEENLRAILQSVSRSTLHLLMTGQVRVSNISEW